MNLNMPAPLIEELAGRGERAAAELTRRFTADPEELELSWDNHRWVRYRSVMSLLQSMFEDIHYAFNNPQPGERSYADLISREPGAEAPRSYPWRLPHQQAHCTDATRELLDLAERWLEQATKGGQYTFGGNVPRPTPELRVRPRI